MKNTLTSKVTVRLAILLFLMGTSMRRSDACRVLIKYREGARANNKEPSLVILQTLKKGPPTPTCPGGCPSYTPGSKHHR
ncbi:hypothetical protein NL676_038562 [Syzygium grande]|nr:hypothetical protein NL676_038562 [Syzygium grande]